MRSLIRLCDGFPRLAELATKASAVAPAVSRWSVGEHLDHLIKAHAGILDLITGTTDMQPCQMGITVTGRVVLFSGYLPRGRGRSPERFLPVMITHTDLRANLEILRARFTQVSPTMPALRDTTTRFAHPVFGGLHRRQWLRFAEIHQRHHIAIIDDILTSSQVTTPASIGAPEPNRTRRS